MAYTTPVAGDSSTTTATVVDTNFKEAALGIYNYAADAGASDTYAVTLSPAPTAYTTGMVVRFKANTANTGACTLNVNTLGAKSIYKNLNEDLADNDIKATQIVSVVYDGTNFQLLSLHSSIARFKTGQTSRGTGSGTGTQNIAHGLGATPKLVIMNFSNSAPGGSAGICVGTGTCTSTSDETCTWAVQIDSAADGAGQTSGSIIDVKNSGPTTVHAASVSTLDATNITLSWDTASGSSTTYIQWQAFS